MGGPTPFKSSKKILARFDPNFIYWKGEEQIDHAPSSKLKKILMKRVRTDDLNFRESLRWWFMGNATSPNDLSIKSSYKFRDGYIYLTLTSKKPFTEAQIEEAYMYNSDAEFSFGPDTWMEGDITIFPRYDYDKDNVDKDEKDIMVEFDPHLVSVVPFD
jgi:hypothetical protein